MVIEDPLVFRRLFVIEILKMFLYNSISKIVQGRNTDKARTKSGQSIGIDSQLLIMPVWMTVQDGLALLF